MNHQWGLVEPKMIGMWQDAMLSITDIDRNCFNGRHQACPNCGGNDRYRFDNELHTSGDGGAICSQCGSGDGMHWMMKLTGMRFGEAVNSLGEFLNMTPPEQIQIRKQNIQSFSSRSKSSQSISEQQVKSIMSKAVEFPTHIYPLSCGIGPDLLMVIQKEKVNDKAEKVVVDSRIAVEMGIPLSFPEKGKSPELSLCNVALINRDGAQDYIAGKSEERESGFITYGAVSVIGRNDRNAIYLCADWADAWHTHHYTGAQVWCCWEVHNLDKVAFKFQKECESGQIRMAVNYDFDELCEAEKNSCRVIIPSSRGKISDGSGFEKVIYDPGSLLDEMTGQK